MAQKLVGFVVEYRQWLGDHWGEPYCVLNPRGCCPPPYYFLPQEGNCPCEGNPLPQTLHVTIFDAFGDCPAFDGVSFPILWGPQDVYGTKWWQGESARVASTSQNATKYSFLVRFFCATDGHCTSYKAQFLMLEYRTTGEFTSKLLYSSDLQLIGPAACACDPFYFNSMQANLDQSFGGGFFDPMGPCPDNHFPRFYAVISE